MSHQNGLIFIDAITTPHKGVEIADLLQVLGRERATSACFVPTSSSQRSLFMALDLATETGKVIINLQDIGLNGEPEACFIRNGRFCIV